MTALIPQDHFSTAHHPQTPFSDEAWASGSASQPEQREEDTRSILTPEVQSRFLDSLSINGTVRLACRHAGVSAQTVYRARRRWRGFRLAWDAALLAARSHAEEALACKALDGWEEPVFYHGELVATRQRFSDRLLLAHLARLDRLAERAELAAVLEVFDDMVEALAEGEELPEPDLASGEEVEREEGAARGLRKRSCGAATPAQAERGLGDGDENECEEEQGDWRHAFTRPVGNSPLDGVPCVPPPSSSGAVGETGFPSSSGAIGSQETTPPCQVCGGECNDPRAVLGPLDCMFLESRFDRMEADRPEGTPLPHEIEPNAYLAGEIERAQLRAYEAGRKEWWLVMPDE
ncbi:MAG: hypothetical protein H6918_11130 [Sphingomonadaceae bacterium]|nr:hypothetical protein [Sphingomonadaceae bacterium]